MASSNENMQSSDEDSSDSSDTCDESPPRLFFYGKIPEVPVDNRSQSENDIFVCKRLDKIYFCENTRPLWMTKIDYSDKESPLDKPFPIVPFSKKSTEIYKMFRSRWTPNLTLEEQKILFGPEAVSKSSKEVILKVLCKSCKPKVTPRPKLPDNFPRSMLRKLQFLTMMKESSRVEKERKAILNERELANQPKDVMKYIMDRAMKKVQDEFNLDENSDLMKRLRLGTPQLCSDDRVAENLDAVKGLTIENQCSAKSNEENIPVYRKQTAKFNRSADQFNSAETFQRKEYLKPDDIEINGKASYNNELTMRKVNLLEKLDRNDIKELKCYFFPRDYEYNSHKEVEYGLNTDTQYDGVPLRRKEFIQAIHNIIGSNELTYAAGELFDRLESNSIIKNGVIWWQQFLDVIISSATPSSSDITTNIAQQCSTKFIPFSKSPIIKIISTVSMERTMFIAVARLGEVAVLDQKLKLEHLYRVPINHYKSKNCCWLTDVCYSSETETIFIVSSSRCLFLYNTSRIVHKLMQCVSGMWEIPECISYSELRKNEGLLLIGDSKGSITSFHFKQTNKSFFKIIPNKNTNDTYFWQDIVDEPDWVEISKERNIHKDIIMQLEYIKRSDCIISCSLDRQLSVAIRQRKANRAPYIFSVDKGVKNFFLDCELSILATISGDTLVRIWDQFNPRKPIGFLKGHQHTVLDVVIIAVRRIAITCAENMELKVWDIETYNCQQTLLMNFKETAHRKHVMLNFRSIYVDYEIQSDLFTGSAAHSSSKVTQSNGNRSNKMEVKSVLIVKINNIKMLKLSGDKFDGSIDEVDHGSNEEISDQQSQSDQQQCEDINIEEEILDFINKFCSDDDDTDKYKYAGNNEFLADFVKEGTPYLALQLHQIADINNDINKTNSN